MKRIAYSLLATLALSVPSQAIVGGPFDNNLFFGRELNATFQGTFTGKNLSGVMIFGTASTSDPNMGSASDIVGAYGSDGRFVTFVDGTMVVGMVTAVADFQGRSISGALDGSRLRKVSSIEETVVVSRTVTNTAGDPTATPPVPPKTEVEIEYEVRSFEVTDTINISGTFDAGFANVYPSIVYSGRGELLLTTLGDLGRTEETNPSTGIVKITYDPELIEREIKIRVGGVRTANTPPFFSNQIPQIDAPGVYPASGS